MQRTLTLIVICGALIASLNMGLRQSFGLFLTPITTDLGLGREAFAFAIALQSLIWGAAQPFAGMIADKFGTARTLVMGGVAYAMGLFIMSGATEPLHLNLGIGVLVGIGAAGTGFAVVLGAVGRKTPPEKRSMVLGIATAGGSFGQFYMAPTGQALIDAQGWSGALVSMALLSLIMIPLAAGLRGRAEAGLGDAPSQSLGEALAEASRHSGFRFLTLGFFVCGFQVMFISVHFPSYLQDSGFAPGLGAQALALIGLGNIIGTCTWGVLGGRYSKKNLLGSLYFLRSGVFLLFLILPKNEVSVLVFSMTLGLLWLGTVPLTSGLVAQIFGPRYMASLFGIVFFSHQLGSFSGVWLGGYVFDTTGSYDMVWIVVIGLGLAASALHMQIAERPLRAAG